MQEGYMYAFFMLMDYPDITLQQMLDDMYKTGCYPVIVITDTEHEAFKNAVANKPEGTPDIKALIFCVNYPEIYEV